MGTHNSLQPIVLISVVLVLWLGTSCARADGSNPTTVSALEALLGSTVEEEPKFFFDDGVYLQFTKRQLSDFLRCLCNKTSFRCQLTYGKAKNTVLKYEIRDVDQMPGPSRPKTLANPTLVCSTFKKSILKTTIICSMRNYTTIPSANRHNDTRGCDFNCINLKWKCISSGVLKDAKEAGVEYKGFGNGPQNSAGELNDSKTRKDKSSDGSFPDDGTVYNNTANSGDKGHKSSDMDNKDDAPKSFGNKHDNYKESDNKGNVPQGNRNKDDGLADKDNEDNSSTIDGIKDDDNNDNSLTDNSHQHDTYSDKENKIDDSSNKSGKDDVSTQKGSKDKDVSTASVVAGIQDEKFDSDSKDRGVVGNQRQESSQVKPFTFGTKFLILTIACGMSVLFNIFCCVFLVSTRSRNRNSEGERPKHSSNEEAKGVENLMYVGHENKEFLNYVPGQASRDSSEGENGSNPTTAETSISGMNFVNNGFNTNEIVPSPRQLRVNRSHQLANPGGVLNFRDLQNKRTSGKSRSAPCPEPSIPLYGNVNDSNMNGDAMSKEQISLYSLAGENLYDTPLNRREHPKSPNCSRPRLNTPPRESNQSSSDIYWRTLNQDGSTTGAGSEYVVADTNDVIPTYDDEEPRRKRRDSEPKIKFVACNATVVDGNVDGLYSAPISYEVDEIYSEI